MTTVQMVYDLFDRLLPRTLSCPWDNDGMMTVPDPEREVTRVLCCVDITDETIDEAVACGAELMLAHHPLIFHPLGSITPEQVAPRRVIRLIHEGIAACSFHTRLDNAEGGINDLLAQLLGLCDTVPFGPDGEQMGRVGHLPSPLRAESFVRQVGSQLGCGSVRCVLPKATVSTVAVLGGGGKSYLAAVGAVGADAYVTGEMSYDAMLDAAAMGIDVLEAGHYETERVACTYFAQTLAEAFPTVEAVCSTCPPPLLYR